MFEMNPSTSGGVLTEANEGNEESASSSLPSLSFIDTMAFLDNGDSTPAYFKHWLGSYVDLSPVGISPAGRHSRCCRWDTV